MKNKRLNVWLFICGLAFCLQSQIAFAGQTTDAHSDNNHASTEHHAPDISTLFWPAVNFSAYFLIILCLCKKVGKPALVARKVEIESKLKQAASLIADSARELAEVEQRLLELDAEREAVILELNEDGQNIAESVIENAKRSAASSKEDTKRLIAGEMARAQSEIRVEVVKTATSRAKEKLVSSLSSDDDQRLRREAMQGI
jgi:F-type H+-transporting ATPase subunit b